VKHDEEKYKVFRLLCWNLDKRLLHGIKSSMHCHKTKEIATVTGLVVYTLAVTSECQTHCSHSVKSIFITSITPKCCFQNVTSFWTVIWCSRSINRKVPSQVTKLTKLSYYFFVHYSRNNIYVKYLLCLELAEAPALSPCLPCLPYCYTTLEQLLCSRVLPSTKHLLRIIRTINN